MSCHACVVVLLGVVASRVTASEVPEWWSGRNKAPVKIWSINAELNMDQETADVSVQGPRGMQEARDVCQYKAPVDNTQVPCKQWREDPSASETQREADLTAAGPAVKPRLVIATKAACCQACEAPYAVHLLHVLAHSLGMLVVLWMLVLLTAVIYIRFC